jgi:hypothetical protein
MIIEILITIINVQLALIIIQLNLWMRKYEVSENLKHESRDLIKAIYRFNEIFGPQVKVKPDPMRQNSGGGVIIGGTSEPYQYGTDEPISFGK